MVYKVPTWLDHHAHLQPRWTYAPKRPGARGLGFCTGHSLCLEYFPRYAPSPPPDCYWNISFPRGLPWPHLKQELFPTPPIPFHCFAFFFNVYHHLTNFNYTCLSVIVHLPFSLNEGRNSVYFVFSVLASRSVTMPSNHTWICEYLMRKE